MSKYKVTPVDQEILFTEDEIIVSKTDLKGRITYANHVFCRMAEMETDELIGEPHSIIRHPDMPRAVFKLLWDTLTDGKEIFAYVINMSKTGKYYWVFAHVTPTINGSGDVIGYHSNRRVAKPSALEVIKPLYEDLIEEENRQVNAKEGLDASFALLLETIDEMDKTYNQLIWQISQ